MTYETIAAVRWEWGLPPSTHLGFEYILPVLFSQSLTTQSLISAIQASNLAPITIPSNGTDNYNTLHYIS